MKRGLVITGTLILFATAFFLLIKPSRSEDIQSDQATLTNLQEASSIKENGGFKTVDPSVKFPFSFSIIENWEYERVLGGNALNIYDPLVEQGSSLEKSKIFVKFFQASDFLKSESFNALSREDREINGRRAVEYILSKKENAPTLNGEPSWRGETHKTVDIRLYPENPSPFFVFAKSPGLSDSEFERFLRSVKFN